MKKAKTSVKFLSLFLAITCCIALLIMPASAQGGTFEYIVTASISNNDNGGEKNGITYLSKGAVVTLQFVLPASYNIASGEVHVEYDPTKYSAAVNTGVVTVANMSASSIITNTARTYAQIDDPSVKNNMSMTNNICQFFFSTDNAKGDMDGGTICEVRLTVVANTVSLSPASALPGGFRIVSAMANYDNGTLVGTDIAKNGVDFTINSTTSAYMLANVPKIQLLMFNYNEDTIINSNDLTVFTKLLTNATLITSDNLRISDINDDGIINSTDYAAIRACITQGESVYVYIAIAV